MENCYGRVISGFSEPNDHQRAFEYSWENEMYLYRHLQKVAPVQQLKVDLYVIVHLINFFAEISVTYVD
jgi:hypothetical protein